jgi:hypothetical protein
MKGSTQVAPTPIAPQWRRRFSAAAPASRPSIFQGFEFAKKFRRSPPRVRPRRRREVVREHRYKQKDMRLE